MICRYCHKPKLDDGFIWCETCRAKRQVRHARLRRIEKAEEAARNPVKKPRKRKPPEKTIDEILKELRAYNEKHGTYLSYGKYIALIRAGRIKG